MTTKLVAGSNPASKRFHEPTIAEITTHDRARNNPPPAKRNAKLSDADKARFGPMLHATWQAIGSDAEPLLSKRGRVGEIIEMVCDANRVQMYGGMNDEDYKTLIASYHNADTKRWLRRTLNY